MRSILIILFLVFILFFMYLIKKQMEKFISINVMYEPRAESNHFEFKDVSNYFEDNFLEDVDQLMNKKCYKGADIYDYTSVY